ncbi:hypothetical protein Dsin_008597 [Dipteronia sinensis]|uniref:Transposase MuDR plant domain-containing protein n=1 Tax=Dipteronia sinensis TaxID=43782 RepID=A0AAE0EBB0_9ROSI|nr:hypothetical protein Dsin_008597 [Dipteronia sinensis]
MMIGVEKWLEQGSTRDEQLRYDYGSLDELSLLDIDDIAISLGYKLPMGYWIQLSRHGMPFNIACDQDLLWFGDKIPGDRVITDDHNGAQPAEEGDGPEVAGAGLEVLIGESVERANFDRIRKGKQVPLEAESDDGLPESDDDGSENLSSLDGSTGEEDQGVQPRKFIKTRYHEFTISRDMQNPVFRLGMEFGSADIFRKAVRANPIKHKKVVQFKKNDSNRVRALCKAECCKWFVFASMLADHKTFKIKSLNDEHTCAISFVNKFVSSKLIVEKYVGQWMENPN